MPIRIRHITWLHWRTFFFKARGFFKDYSLPVFSCPLRGLFLKWRSFIEAYTITLSDDWWVIMGCPSSSIKCHVTSRDSTTRGKRAETERNSTASTAASSTAWTASTWNPRLGRQATGSNPASEVFNTDSTGTGSTTWQETAAAGTSTVKITGGLEFYHFIPQFVL